MQQHLWVLEKPYGICYTADMHPETANVDIVALTMTLTVLPDLMSNQRI